MYLVHDQRSRRFKNCIFKCDLNIRRARFPVRFRTHGELSGKWYQCVFSNECRNIRLEETSGAPVLCRPLCHRAFSWTSLAPSKSYDSSFSFPIEILYLNFPPIILTTHWLQWRDTFSSRLSSSEGMCTCSFNWWHFQLSCSQNWQDQKPISPCSLSILWTQNRSDQEWTHVRNCIALLTSSMPWYRFKPLKIIVLKLRGIMHM